MTTNLRIAGAIAATMAVAMPAASANAAPQFRLTKLAAPAGSPSSVARAISANGRIAGEGLVSSVATGNTPVNYGSTGSLASVFTAQPVGTTNGFVRGVNDSGVGAGTAQNVSASTSQAILTGIGGVSVLAPLTGLANAGATGIANNGTVVGYSMSIGIFAAEGTARPISGGQGVQKATIWTGGIATELANPFGNFNSLATAINASGQVVGASNGGTSPATGRATIWSGGVGTALATASGFRSAARAISSAGWVAGRTDNLSDGSFKATVWAPAGSPFTLAASSVCASSDLRGINAARNAVGFSQQGGCPVNNGSIGGYWDWNGTGYDAYDINSLVTNLDGWNLFAPQAINDMGQIVGFGVDENGVTRAFLLTAVPEPSSWVMLIAGFGLVGAALRRRRLVAA